jgi:peptide/nickel transport system ATP-binding protein
VFQDPYGSFNPSRTIGQSVAETLGQGSRLSREATRRRVGEMLTRVGIEPKAMDRYPNQFSGGQRQRIAIARALLPSPRLVICDEPVSALDLSVQAQVLNLLLDLRRDLDVAFLFISHDMAVVQYLCDRVVVLQRGEIVESGDVAAVCGRPQDPYTRMLLAAAPVADPIRQAARREQRRQSVVAV